MSWGHAVSPDLLHWEHLPVAIPETDSVMAFSGSAVVDWNNTSGFGTDDNPPMIAIYTGHYRERSLQAQYIAWSTDRGRTWTPYEGNPVLDLGLANFRDPKVFWYAPEEKWVMVVALSGGRKVYFYSSKDLKSWTFLSEFGPAGNVTGIWECPDTFELPIENRPGETRRVLDVDASGGTVAGGSGGQYFVGHFDGTTFVAEHEDSRRPLRAKPRAHCAGGLLLRLRAGERHGRQLDRISALPFPRRAGCWRFVRGSAHVHCGNSSSPVARAARAVLERLGEVEIDNEMAEIVASLKGEVGQAGSKLLQRRYTLPILLAWGLAMFNQLSGINALMYYAPRIFGMAGAGVDDALLQSVAVGGTNLLFTISAFFIIDRFGRRPLMIVGSAGTAVCLGLVAWAFFVGGDNMGTPVLIGLLGFIAFFALSQGAVIWVFLSEIFPNRVRSKGQSLGSFTHWFMAAAVSWTFPVVAEASGGFAFAFFSVMMVLQLFFAVKVMPETKGLSLEELEVKLGIGTAELEALEERLHAGGE